MNYQPVIRASQRAAPAFVSPGIVSADKSKGIFVCANANKGKHLHALKPESTWPWGKEKSAPPQRSLTEKTVFMLQLFARLHAISLDWL